MKRFPLPLILTFLLAAVLLGGAFVPVEMKSLFLGLSLSLKSLLLFVLPFIIIVYLASSFIAFEGNIFRFLIVLLLAVCASNFLSTLIAYGLAHKGLPFLGEHAGAAGQELLPFWTLNVKPILSNDMALVLGFFIGIGGGVTKNHHLERGVEVLKNAANFFLTKIFIPVIPLFVLGFLFKMEAEGVLAYILQTYFPVVCLLLIVYGVYLSLLYWMAAGFCFKKAWGFMKQVFPAGITGFSTMSSAAALPITLRGAEINSGQPKLVRAIVPATVSIHLVGDSIGVPLLAMAILTTFGYPLPDWSTFLVFSGYFILAKFAIAAVPGGGIIVMIPVLEKYLGFTGEMTGLITALYMLFDPLFTSVNVMGNGAFSVLLSRWMTRKN